MTNRKGRILFVQMVVVLCFLLLSFPLAYSQEGTVTLSIGDGAGLPGSTDNPVQIGLDNSEDRTTGMQVDICDTGDLLTPSLNDPPPGYVCETTGRAASFSCLANEIAGGCVRVIVADFEGGSFIEVGTGPIITLKYDVSEGASIGECKVLSAENAKITSCVDDGEGGCTPGSPFDNVTLEDGEFCFGDPITTTTTTTPTTTTTTPTTTTTTPTTTTTTPTTTTTTITSSYKVTISPSSATLDSDASLQFSVNTTYGGEEVGGTYTWEIVPESTIGSVIDGNGLFTAGANTTESVVEETVKVTDTEHENKSATATVTIKIKEQPPPECEVKINPSSATVFSGDILPLTASTIGEECEPGDYEWSINTEIESVIDQEGNYTAGSNDTGSQVTDTITVVDHANGDISESAVIAVESEELVKNVTVFPPILLGSRWIPLPYILLITGEDTKFDLNSTIHFEPGGDVLKLCQFGFGNIMFAIVFLSASPQEGAVNVIITTDGEVAVGEIAIELLPSPLAEGYSL